MRRPWRQGKCAVSRRGFLAIAASSICAAQEPEPGRVLPSAAVKYPDPATEFVVIRLTDPQYSAVLPSDGTKTLSNRTMLYASDATGKWEALRMDLKTFESTVLTDAAQLDPRSLSYVAAEKGFWHFDGGTFRETLFSGHKTREVYRVPEGFVKTPGVAYAEDGRWAVFVERGDKGYRLRLVDLARGMAKTLAEDANEIREPLLRPKRASAIYRVGPAVWTVDFANGKKQRLTLAEGEVGQYQWGADGRALAYLNRPADPKKLIAIRQWAPETQKDSKIADTTQFASFSANADGSVFAGASGSKASPYVLLLARAVKREFTLAEHKASDSRMVAPMFTPNSQGLAFQSDRHGKPAIYWMAVEKFVAETGGS
jgi:oligogalacturonide lyase